MITFPSFYITEINEDDYFPESKIEFGDLYVSTAPEFTKSLKIFTLTIEGLEIADRQTLTSFFTEHQGSTFLFIEPETRTEYTVKFYDMDKVSFKRIPGKTSSTSVTLKEVA